jgi:hypothetical protein
MMNIDLFLTVLLLLAIMTSSGLADVVINEVELNPPEDDEQWVELYNSGDNDVDISGWSITPLSNPSKEEFIGFENISAKEFYMLSFEDGWLNSNEEVLILRNDEGTIVDRTPVLYDLEDSYCAWGRYPDGSSNWAFMRSTLGGPSSGEPCEEAESKSIKFEMDQSVSGNGYVRISSLIQNSVDATFRSRESGSGTYNSEEAVRYSENLIGPAYTINMSKSNLSARYSNTTFPISPERSVRYATKWSESSISGSDRDSPYLSASYMYATRLDSDILIDNKNYELAASIGTEFEGVGRINSNLNNFNSSEEYAGKFKISNHYSGNDTNNEIKLSAKGEGYVSINREIADKVRAYERGTGAYQSDALIGAGGSSGADTEDISFAKNVSLSYFPANYSYASNNPIPTSIMWEEGTILGGKDGAFISSEFSDIRKLEEETTIVSSEDMRTSASFSGRARLQAGYREPSDPAQRFVHMDDEYVGNYSIKRSYKIFPVLKVPHIFITSQGHIDPQNCNILKYTITLVNDGNRSLGPLFLRSSFPSGTSYVDSSIQPFELTSRYANWSISYLGIGESFNIDLDLQITSRKENYTISSRAITIYQAKTATTSRDRKLRASNTSRMEADWGACSPQNLSATYTVTPNSKNPSILAYRLTVQNLAEENMSVNITATLPPNIRFINSTNQPEQISEDMIVWTVDKLNTGKRRTISFMGRAEDDGFYVNRAYIHARSLNGSDMASINISASVMLGKTVYVITPTFWQDWCPCDENLLGSQSWNETMIARGKDLGCVC